MMGNNLVIGAKVTIDASQAVAGSKETAAALEQVGVASTTTETKLQRLINASAGLHSGVANQNMREWRGALADEGLALDRLRAKYNPMFAVISQYKAAMTEIRTAHAQGALSADEMTAAIQRQRQAALASIDVIKNRNSVMASGGRFAANGNNERFAALNAGFQVQDIFVSSASGQDPWRVAVQQGPQLVSAMQSMERPAAGIASAVLSMISPLSLVTIGLTGITAAAVSYFTTVATGTESSDKKLKEHRDSIIEAGKAWGEAYPEFKKYADELEKQRLKDERKDIAKLTREGIYRNVPGNTPLRSVDSADTLLQLQGAGTEAAEILRLQKAIGVLDAALAANTATSKDAEAIQFQLAQLYEQTHIPAVLDLANAYRKLGDELGKVAPKADAIGRELLPSGLTGRGLDRTAIDRMTAQNEGAMRLAEREFDQWQKTLFAKSPAEKAAAARDAAANDVRTGESPEARQQRIELAGKRALIQEEKALADAQKERARTLENSLESQRLEVSLIGKSAGEAERLKMEFRLISELKAEAARNGTIVDPAEVERIKQAAAEYGRLVEQQKALTVLRAQDDELSMLQLKSSILGQNERIRTRLLALAEAEQKIRDQGISANSAEAAAIRQKSVAIAEQTAELKRQEAAWSKIQGTAENSIDSLTNALVDGDWKGALDSLLKDWQKTLLQLSVANPLKNAALGTNYETISDVGGIKGIIGRLFGGGGMQTASMQVAAGSVIVNGGVSGGLGSLFGGSAANSNSILGGGALGGSTALTSQGGVAGQIWNFFASKGLKAHQIAGILGNVSAESAFNPLAIGDGGNAFGLFQHNDRAPALLSFLGGRQNLGNVQGQLEFAWKELQTSESGALQRLLASNDVRSATAAFGGFERPQGWSPGNPEAMSQWTRRLSAADDALAKFGNTTSTASSTLGDLGTKSLNQLSNASGAATQGLGTFGNGLNNMGNNLASAFSNVGGGGSSGGIGGLLASLLSPNFTPTTSLGSIIYNGFDNGGFTGDMGWKDIAGVVHGGEFVVRAGIVSRPGMRKFLEALNDNRGYEAGGYVPRYAGTGLMAANGNATASAPMSVAINNYSSAKVEDVQETRDERGGRHISFTIADEVGAAIGKKGGGAKKQLESGFGLRARGVRR